MTIYKISAWLCFTVVFVAGCATQQRIDAVTQDQLRWSAELTEKRRVNTNWSADCTTDAVTGSRRCFAGTFGQPMNSQGSGYGGKNIPFQVYYYDKLGPFLSVGAHSYPGRTPTLRIDNDGPFRVEDDGGVSVPTPQPELVNRLRASSVVRARYHVWPDGKRDMIIETAGFEQAWQRLQELVQGATAPVDTVTPSITLQ